MDVIASAPAFVVGFAAEASIAVRLGWSVAIGGGSATGAGRAVQRLIDAGATGVVSFGLAGGLDPNLAPGTLIIADAIVADGTIWRTDRSLNARLGGSTGHLSLGLDQNVGTAGEKQLLWQETGAAVVDRESGAVAAAAAAAGVPFAVLRAICDAADRDLPPAALVALDPAGRIALAQVARSVVTHPRQVPALVGLARNAMAARRTLRERITMLQQ